MKHYRRNKGKSFMAGVMAVCLAVGMLPSTVLTAFAAQDVNDPYAYNLEQTALVEAVEEAVEEGSLANDMPSFSGDSAGEYESLFEQDGSLYEVSLDALNLEKSKERDAVLDLRVFVRVDEDAVTDGSYVADGSEDVLFLLENKSEDTVTAKIYLDEKESHRITVCSAEEIIPTETAEDPVLDADTSEEEVEAVEAEPEDGAAVEAEEAEVEELDAAEAAEIDEDSEDAIDEDGEDAIDEDSEAAVDESSEDVIEEGSEDEQVVEEAAPEEEPEEPAAELAEEDPIDGEDLLDGTIYDSVCADDNGAAAFAMTLPVDVEYEIMTLAEGDVYSITYSANNSVVEFSDGNPETVTEGDTLAFSFVIPDGYTIASVTANNTELSVESRTETPDGKYQYEYQYAGEDGGGVMEDVAVEVNIDKGQVIDGYGQFIVTDQQSRDPYTVTVQDVPTNTAISLSYNKILVTNESGDPLGVTLTNRLYFVPTGSEEVTDDWEEVSYLMLNGSKKTGTGTDDDGETITYYEVVAYDADGNAFDLTKGSLWLKNITIVSARADIMPIQTNTLCALDEEDAYTQELIGATEMSSSYQTFYCPGYEGDYVELSRLTNGKDYKFYYGKLGDKDEYGYNDISDLTECEYGQIVSRPTVNEADEPIYEYEIYPLDEEGTVVDLESTGYSLYMEYDQVYSFDVVINSIVNEHTEDNGDVYLWKGTEYYVDQYKNQGYDYVPGYTRSQNTLANCGIWVQLARIREPIINAAISSGTSAEDAFGAYANVSYQAMLDEGVDLNGYDAQNAKDTAEANAPYGIVGPLYVSEGATDITQTTERVTGHIGDEFIASDAFGANIVYVIPDDTAHEAYYHEDWIDLGAHASDNGYRSWFYWINNYYKLNDNEDELEYVEIVEREDGEIHLEADEMGTSGLGEDYDVWNSDLYTKRDSVVKAEMLENQTSLESQNVGFDERVDTMNHIQLRKPGTVEIVNDEDGEVYHGELSILFDDIEAVGTKAPYISYSIEVYDPDDPNETMIISDSSYMKEENDQESEQLKFDNYYKFVDKFDPEKVKIYVEINFTGTLTSDSGKTIEFTEDSPFAYSGYLTAEQLKEAYDTCPVYNGYDVAVNISNAVQQYINTDTEIILYKVWDDNLNANESRGDVDGIVVTLERSEDGTTWETVMDKEDPTKAAEFTILPPLLEEESGERDLNASQWSLVLTSEDLDLTYGEGDDEGYYSFRIATEEFRDGEETNPNFTYNTIITGTSVTNTLMDDTLDITGEKLWEDAEGAPLADIPVDDVIITLYQDGHYFDRQTVKAEGSDSKWEFGFYDLPRWNGAHEYEYTLAEMLEDGTTVEDGQSVLLGNDWFHFEILANTDEDGNQDGTYTFSNVENPKPEKDEDADGDGEYGDTGMGVQVGDTVTYKIDYENYYPTVSTVVITDQLDEGLDYVEDSASNGGVYDEDTRTITWTLENVGGKAQGSVTFDAVVNENALVRNEVDNTAEVQVADDPAVETNTVYNPVPDKDVDADGDGEYKDSGMEVQVGGTLVYKIDYENPDDDPATVTITDEVDIGLDFVEATDGGSYDDDARLITWVIEDVEAHTNGSVYFTATVNETALVKSVVENTATVQVGEHGAQQTKTVYNPLTPNEKDVDADGDGSYGDTGMGVQVGDTVSYEITYFNEDEQAADVVITDELDEGLDYVVGSASDDGVYDEATRTITWTLENVESNTGGRVTFDAVVNENALERNEIENSARIKYGDNPDEVWTNKVYNPVPDKDVDADGDEVFEDSGMTVEVGGTVVYKIDYENPDDEAATVTITDEVDVGLDFESATDGGSYDDDAHMITWVIEGVAPHTNGSVYFTATVNENALEKNVVENTATVQVGNHDAQQTKTVYNPLEADEKSVDVDGNKDYDDNGESVKVGDTVSYEISYFNEDEQAADVVITDELDEGLDYVEGSASDDGVYDEDTRTITWTLEGVESHTGGRVTFDAVVNESALERNEVENSARIKYGDNPDEVWTNKVYNPVPDKDVDADGDDVFEDSGMVVEVGGTVVYKIDYENPDDDPATVTITDEVDAGLDFESATDGGTYDDDARMITWVIENVEAHTNGSVYFTATVNEDALIEHIVYNTATVQVGNHAEQQTKTVYNPLEGDEKDVDADGDEKYGDTGMGVQVGDTVSYMISYFNTDEQAADVVITDTLDEGLDYVEGSASNDGVYDEATRTITWTIEGVDALTGGSVTFDAVVNETALVRNEIENSAEIKYSNNPDEVWTNTVYNPVPDKDVDADGDGEFKDSGMQVQIGDTLVYKIDYQNPDDEAATVTITDELDEGLDFVSASDGGTYDKDTRTITWVLPDVAPHSEEGYYVTFTAIVNENAKVKNYVDNTAFVQVGNHDEQQTKTVYNPVPTKDVDADENHIYGDNGEEVYVGETLTYTINYFNGYDVEEEVFIEDKLDEGLTFVEASDGGSYDADSHTITWDIEHVEAHTAGAVTFSAVVNGSSLAKNEVDNIATVQIRNYSVQTNEVENPVPDKDVDADGDGTYGDDGMPVNVGDTLTYRVDYHNSYDDPTDVIITDVLDEGLDFVSASDNGSYDESTRTITWTIADVDPHTTGNVTFQATVNETALVKNEVENTATVQVGEYSQVTNTVHNPVPQKDVDIHGDGTFGDSGLKVSVGDELTYKIDYENPDEAPATVTITDVLDEGLDFVSADNGGTYDESTRTITWVIPDVEANTNGSVTFVATANEKALANGEVDNTATVQVGDHPEQQTNTVWNPLWEPEKSVDTDGNGDFEDDGVLVNVGDELVYKVTYKNYHDEAADITITDTLDADVTFVSATDDGLYDAGTHMITWTFSDVEAGYEGDVQFTVKVKEDAVGKHYVDNTATVKVGNDSQDTNTVYNPVPEKSVDVNGDEDFSDNGVKVEVGDELVYKIDYTNGHNDVATVTITDPLDPNVEFISATDGGSYDEATHTVTWVISNVAARTEGSVEFTVKVLASAEAENEVDNTASVQVGNDAVVDTNPTWNPLWEPEKSVDTNGDGKFEDDGVLVHVGDELVYQVTYKNYQEEAATIRITDVLDPNVEFVSATDDGAYDTANHTITWILDNVAAGDEGTVQFTVTVLASALAESEVDNTASVKVGNDAAMDTNKVENPLWEPVKSVDTDRDGIFEDDGVLVHVGDELVYRVTYKNYQDEAATIKITDALDPNVEFVSATDDGNYSKLTHTITWTLDNVAAGDEGTVQFTVTVLEGAEEAGEVVNTASVKVGNDEAQDTNTVRNPVSGTTPEPNPWEPLKSVDTNGDGIFEDDGVEVKVGDELDYEITYKNYQDEAATITITDALDSNVEFVSASAGSAYDEATHTITWILDNVAAGDEGTVQFTVTALQGAEEAGEVINTASVKVGNDEALTTNTVRNPVPKETSENPNPKSNPTGSNPNGSNPNGSNPNSGTSGTGSTGTPKTGDVNYMYLWIMLIIAAAAVTTVGVFWRTRRTGARK